MLSHVLFDRVCPSGQGLTHQPVRGEQLSGSGGPLQSFVGKLEFPSSLELFPPPRPALNVHSCGSGLDNSAGICSGGVDHMLNNLDIGYFDKVKCSTPETCKRAQLSDTSDKNPVRNVSSGLWTGTWLCSPHICQQSPAGASLGAGTGYYQYCSNGSKASFPS